MPANRITVLEVLKMVDDDLTIIIPFIPESDPSTLEALEFGLIYRSDLKYRLTKEGLTLLRSGISYEDYLRERFPPKKQIELETKLAIKATHTGMQPVNKLVRYFMMLTGWDYFKFTVIGVLITILSYFVTEYLKYKKW